MLLFFPRDADHRRQFWIAKLLLVAMVVFAVATLGTGIGLIYGSGPCDTSTLAFAYSLGLIATIINFCQWLPQIYSTYRLKVQASRHIHFNSIGEWCTQSDLFGDYLPW